MALAVLLAGLCAAGCDRPSSSASRSVVGTDLDSADMKAAVLETIKASDTLERNRRWVAIADALDEQNLPGALEAFDEALNHVDEYEVRLFANKWARIDPEGALNHITSTWRYPKATNQAVNEIVYVWARNDSEAAAEYVAPSFDGPITERRSPKKFMILATLRALAAEGDLDELTRVLSTLEDDGDRGLWLTQVMREMNRARGNDVTQAWVESIPWDTPNNVKRAAFNRALDWLARISPTAAAEWYEEFEGERDISELLRPVVNAWGVQDPGAALLWLSDREKSATQASLAREVYRGWFDWGPEYGEEAEAWTLAHRGVPIVEDHLVMMLGNVYVHRKRYEEAAELVASARPDLMRVGLPIVFAEWATLDENEVAAYIEANQVSEEIVDAYRTRVENRPVKVQRRRAPPPAKNKNEAK